VLSCPANHAEEVLRAGLPVTRLGVTGGNALKIETSRGELSWDLARLRDVWWNAIGRLMDA
jgi:hypothetical protein